MKIIITSIVMLFATSSFSQQVQENKFFNDISVDYGIFASLNSDKYENLVGNKLSFQTSWFFINDFGIKTGVSFTRNLEGSNMLYSVPLQLVYRTPVYKSSEIYIDAMSLTDLVFQFIIGLMPKQYEISIGTNLGYIEPNNNISLVSINNGFWLEEGYSAEQRFVSTIDLGVKGKYKIGRFGVAISPALSYLLTKNFKYYSEVNPYKEYYPTMFLSFTFGLSYEF
ncbi:MAG TPA: hypothetical protein DCG75_18405 [Bacteroidales bacterium]|jgi:hypothetical protein|nr:hypothetical protein [Bacteroidales bacterium]